MLDNHQVLHVEAEIAKQTRKGNTEAISELQDIKDGIKAWPDARMHPADIHTWIRMPKANRTEFLETRI